jgi:NADH:ubiquinone oxidoreductase subunit F (NADH-binding)
MNKLEKEYIEKLEELIKWFHGHTVTAEWCEDKDVDEYNKLKSEIASLKAEVEKEKPKRILGRVRLRMIRGRGRKGTNRHDRNNK